MKNISVLKESFDLGSFSSSFLGILIVLVLFNSQTTHAQWYGELGLNSSSFRDYTNDQGASVISDSYSRSLEVSAAAGYRLNLLKGKLQWGVGLNFDKHQINVSSNELQFLNYNYVFSYFGPETDLYFKFYELGNDPVKKLSFWLRGGIGISWPVNGVQQITSSASNMRIDLLDQPGFSGSYNFYKYGLDFQYRTTVATSLYLSITNNHSFSIKEVTSDVGDGQRGEERFGVNHLNFALGIIHDFNLFKSNKIEQETKAQDAFLVLQERISALEDNQPNKQKEIERLEGEIALLIKNQEIKDSYQKMVWSPELIVLFEIDKADLALDTQVHIEALASAYLKTSMTQTIKIFGFADDQTGNMERNRKLSSQRAQVVAELMMAMGVPKSKIEWIGKGQTSSHSATTPELNRRVEIFFE
ncbi:MAG: OmpA family protein [Flavobacteriaceae bacterium]